MQNPISIYDMDKTITRHPTFTPFLIYAARTHEPLRLLLAPLAVLAVLLYMLGRVDRARLKEINHRLLLGPRVPRVEADRLAAGFADVTLRGNVLADARAAIARDRAEGRRLLLATASYEFYASAIGQALGFDDVVATRCTSGPSGAVIAQIEGENCYGLAKRRMVEAWLSDVGLARDDCHVRFYSDHVSDAPMFEWADEPVAVNAHAPLAALAQTRGWRSEDWR